MIEKLKILERIDIYSSESDYYTYKNIILPLKQSIISEEIKVTECHYGDEYDEKYKPYSDAKNWGSNLDSFTLNIGSNLKGSLSYHQINRYSSLHSYREFKFKIEFKLPKKLLSLFSSTIERDFYYKCAKIREKELEQIEEKRIKEIGEELLKGKIFEE